MSFFPFRSREMTEISKLKLATESSTDKVRMSILREGRPVTTVSLGEELELRWIIDDDARRNSSGSEKYGFFVEECTAERLDGLPPEPTPLPLIIGGYVKTYLRLLGCPKSTVLQVPGH